VFTATLHAGEVVLARDAFTDTEAPDVLIPAPEEPSPDRPDDPVPDPDDAVDDPA
jgi:hypothetical protein